ncbi:DUF4911 domain-containing protein [Desulfosporosinus sp. SYSU MS00001]|uniref:DUF4911 domain-containing protein n=1 Tax=Desulfosporosinus sp. SYSU MS00001 TaxID=3416284 RepID=UPI003CEFEC6F
MKLSDQAENKHLDNGFIVKARMDRSQIQMLCKLVEGLGHLGIVTTTNKELGEVMFQTTKDCWPELKKVVEKMPVEVQFL